MASYKISTFYVFTLLILGFLSPAPNANGQSAISGVVNQYAAVQGMVGNNKVWVNDPSAFAINDRVLIIQMQGATIDETNSATFGTITDTGSAGRYELNTICAISGDTLIFQNQLGNTYSTAHKAQAVNVPQYQDATVTGTLSPSPWNGTTGGVLAIEVNGTLNLSSDMDASGAGFQGGDYTPSTAGCDWWVSYPDFFYATGNGNGLAKGNGIAAYITDKEWGKGPQANGGGGGNNHNSGGGGGANVGVGGQGGENQDPGNFTCHGYNPGLGGNPLSASSNRWYLGGGGGSGHGNNTDPGSISSGGNGGGIIFIRADLLVGNGYQVSAAGEAGGYALNDGAGGGGAGGTVILDVNNYHGSTLNIDVSGGDGGDADNEGVDRCFGPGGGGGGGAVLSTTSLPVQIAIDATGGTAGETINSTICSGSLNATNGGTGQTMTGASIMEPGIPGSGCATLLPIEGLLLWVEKKGKEAFLAWKWEHTIPVDQFIIEYQDQTGRIATLGKVHAKAGQEKYKYSLSSLPPGQYYLRIGIAAEKPSADYSRWITWTSTNDKTTCKILPNPVSTGQAAIIDVDAINASKIVINTFDNTGRQVHQRTSQASHKTALQFPQPGIYHLRITNGHQTCRQQVIVRP